VFLIYKKYEDSMNYKAAAVKDVLAKMKKKGIYKHPHATDNPAVQAEEHTPGTKVPLPLKSGSKGGAKSNHPAFVKPKGTVENPTAAENVGKVVTRPVYYKKAKTRGA
jgi:hypothetical protein